MDLKQLCPRVYALLDCSKCEVLKTWLKEREIEFEEKMFDTETQLDFIMRNVFGNPPLLELGETVASSEELFNNEILEESKVKEVLGSAKA